MWHQLTEAVLTIVKTEFLQQSGLMEVRVCMSWALENDVNGKRVVYSFTVDWFHTLQFYKNFLVDFEHK